MAAVQITPTWPTVDEYAEATRAVGAAEEQLDELHFLLHQLMDPNVGPSLIDGAPAPTFDDLGRLSVFVAEANLNLDLCRGQVERLEEIRTALALELDLTGDSAVPERRNRDAC